MNVLVAVAQLLIERTKSGLRRAVSHGKKLGRKAVLTADQHAAIRLAIAEGASVSSLARRYETSRQTIMRARQGEEVRA
jgi:putative DNA-invertase from lambdoid prophage Rac